MTALPYPRDLRGYGRDLPHAHWPGGARVAVQFVLNYEEGFSAKPYYCSAGYPTIGIGQRIGPKGAPLKLYEFTVSKSLAAVWLAEKVKETLADFEVHGAIVPVMDKALYHLVDTGGDLGEPGGQAHRGRAQWRHRAEGQARRHAARTR